VIFTRDAICQRGSGGSSGSVFVRLSVCPSQAGNCIQTAERFLTQHLPSTYLTPCLKKFWCRCLHKVRVFSSGTLSRTLKLQFRRRLARRAGLSARQLILAVC